MCANLKSIARLLTNRTMVALLNRVTIALYEGLQRKDIDMAFKSGFNWLHGSTRIERFHRPDTLLHITEDLYKRRGGDKYTPVLSW
jgi:3-hydroxyacyl-CoA dehydrogenase